MPQTAAVPLVPSGSTQSAYESLRGRIASGELAPGAWLRESALAEELGVSRTPVREALRAVAAEGLVELVHHRGARVVAWTAQDIDETYRLRALLEGEAAALAARRSSGDQIEAMAQAQQRYERSVDDAAPPDVRAVCNDDFHHAVLAASGSSRLPVLIAALTSTPLVARAVGSYGRDDLQRSVLAHRDVLAAVRRGDEELASSAMRGHILAARYAVMSGAT